MRESDLPAIMEIERASFPSPWPAGAFVEEIRSASYSSCIVARTVSQGSTGMPLAYICFWILGDELIINNLAVHPDGRRQGLARRLLRHALSQGRASRCKAAHLEVRPSNLAAIHLYQGHGFRVAGRRRGYYAESGEDALLMRADLESP